MKIAVAIDSWKGSLSSLEAGKAVRAGIRKIYPQANIVVRPLADGGEGTVEVLTEGMGGEIVAIDVTGPLGTPLEASYGFMERDGIAVMEMSQAAGLTLVPNSQRNPLKTTTYGMGELILDAVKRGCRRFIVGIGGSATNDAGVGMLQALGYDFLDIDGKCVPRGAEGLKHICQISAKNVPQEIFECSFQIACDVANPLCGVNGCSAVYGPQKGATPQMVKEMDAWMENYVDIVKAYYPDSDSNMPGAGAAGGIGYAFASFLNGSLKPGIQVVLESTCLENYLKESDIVVTGEGRLDGQSIMGKAPVGVARLAKKYGIPVIAFAGCVSEDAGLCNHEGIDAYFPVLPFPMTLEEAMKPEMAKANLESAAEQAFRLIKSISRAPAGISPRGE